MHVPNYLAYGDSAFVLWKSCFHYRNIGNIAYLKENHDFSIEMVFLPQSIKMRFIVFTQDTVFLIRVQNLLFHWNA